VCEVPRVDWVYAQSVKPFVGCEVGNRVVVARLDYFDATAISPIFDFKVSLIFPPVIVPVAE
jgi:hypothetical protein